MSVGSKVAGMMEVRYTLKTSGIDTSGPVRRRPGRSLAPTVPATGNLARWISPGFMTRLPVLECVRILARIAPVLGPGLVDQGTPVTLLVLGRCHLQGNFH